MCVLGGSGGAVVVAPAESTATGVPAVASARHYSSSQLCECMFLLALFSLFWVSMQFCTCEFGEAIALIGWSFLSLHLLPTVRTLWQSFVSGCQVRHLLLRLLALLVCLFLTERIILNE